jgi:hypothetical protein
MSMDFIRRTYGLNCKRGDRVRFFAARQAGAGGRHIKRTILPSQHSDGRREGGSVSPDMEDMTDDAPKAPAA